MDKLFSGVELLKGSLPSNGVVGLYFSAHWCPPCRGFTPKLAEAYKDIKEAADKPFEVVFISSDKDQKQFDEYFAEMPWLGLPYEQRELKGKLSKKFKVNGIPSLILLDAKTGKVITTDGRSAITKDPKGAKYPWTPPNPLEALGSTFVGEGKDTSIKGKYVGIYFSAHWCGPCRNFTPKLAETYKKLKAAGKEFEVVFCSADRDQTQFDEYFGTMPWIALPFEDRERAETLNEVSSCHGTLPCLILYVQGTLSGRMFGVWAVVDQACAPPRAVAARPQLFGVEGIPSLVILAPDGTTVTTDGTDAVRGARAAAGRGGASGTHLRISARARPARARSASIRTDPLC